MRKTIALLGVLGVVATACGGGEDVSTAAAQKMQAIWELNLLDVTPSTQAMMLIHPDGWGVIDNTNDNGATWCRTHFTWAVSDVRDANEFTFTRTYTKESCGFSVGDTWVDRVLQCDTAAGCPGVDPSAPSQYRMLKPDWCQAGMQPGDHCDGFDNPDAENVGWWRCTNDTTMTNIQGADACNALPTRPGTRLQPNYGQNQSFGNWGP